MGSELKKNFYKILGVNQEADPARIKRAYRRAAKRYHPDVSPRSEEKFKEVQTAYETLSDPEKKAAYDGQFMSKPYPRIKSSPHPDLSSFSHHLFNQAEKLFSDMDGFWNNPFDSLFDTYGEDRGDLRFEVILSPEEAAAGCEIPVEIPFSKECSRCHGTGRARGLICGLCRGEGRERLVEKIIIEIPSGVESGMVIRERIHLEGQERNIILTLKVRFI